MKAEKRRMKRPKFVRVRTPMGRSASAITQKREVPRRFLWVNSGRFNFNAEGAEVIAEERRANLFAKVLFQLVFLCALCVNLCTAIAQHARKLRGIFSCCKAYQLIGGGCARSQQRR